MIITEEVRNYQYNKINSVENFVNLCMESYIVTTDNKYLSILIDDHKLFEAYDAEWKKAEAVGDQTTDTNDTKADTEKEINMLRAMLRTTINKSKEYIKEKIKWLKEWYKNHFSEEHLSKMKKKAKDLWDKVKEKFHYVMSKLIEKLNSSDEEEDFEFAESTGIIISVDNEIDSISSCFNEDTDTAISLSDPDTTNDDDEYGLHSYSGFRNYGTKSKGQNELDHLYVTTPVNKNDKHTFKLTGDFTPETNKKLKEKIMNISKEYDKVNHPKSWISKKIAWLRGLYNKLMIRIDKVNHRCVILKQNGKKGILLNLKKSLSGLASTIMHLIDRMANKLQLMFDKD